MHSGSLLQICDLRIKCCNSYVIVCAHTKLLTAAVSLVVADVDREYDCHKCMFSKLCLWFEDDDGTCGVISIRENICASPNSYRQKNIYGAILILINRKKKWIKCEYIIYTRMKFYKEEKCWVQSDRLQRVAKNW